MEEHQFWMALDGSGQTYAVGQGDKELATGLPREVAALFSQSGKLRDALVGCSSVLTQLQDHPDKAADILRQGYFGAAVVKTQAALAPLT